MAANFGGDGGVVELAASRTGPGVGLMLGDESRQWGQFGDLMPGRLGVIGARLDRQGELAPRTNRREIGVDEVDPLGGQADAVMSAMPGLSAGLSSGGGFARKFGSVERIGRRRRGTVRRVLLEPKDQFLELSFERGDPRQSDVGLSPQLGTSGTIKDGQGFGKIHRLSRYADFRQSQEVERPVH